MSIPIPTRSAGKRSAGKPLRPAREEDTIPSIETAPPLMSGPVRPRRGNDALWKGQQGLPPAQKSARGKAFFLAGHHLVLGRGDERRNQG